MKERNNHNNYEKMYKLTIRQQQEQPLGIVVSSFTTPTVDKKVEYYATREGADSRKNEIYAAIEKYLGFPLNIQVDIQEINLII